MNSDPSFYVLTTVSAHCIALPSLAYSSPLLPYGGIRSDHRVYVDGSNNRLRVNTYLTAIIISQFFTYWNSSGSRPASFKCTETEKLPEFRDPLWMRSMVAFLFIINAAQAAAVIYMSWNFTNPNVVASKICNYSIADELNGPRYLPSVGSAHNLLGPTEVLQVTALLALINQTFQSWRIYVLTQSKILFGFLLAAGLAACGMGVAAAIQSWIFSELAKLAALQPVVEGNLALQCAIDVIITGRTDRSSINNNQLTCQQSRLVHDVLQVKDQLHSDGPGAEPTDAHRGPVWIIHGKHSRSVAAVFALGTLLSFRISPGTYMIALFALPIGRIYTQTLMDHLISREQLRNILSNGGDVISVPDFSGVRTDVREREHYNAA
ncbi:hypothetical protein B0H17DRAFT_1136185 [Mycena rosella]|uniref:Uncharacterized protein n=1 Tax=Mycena rosella TaxID=1033263 RepID=A0AAD7DBW8_MYCRO|nr:hypothetical protein B0H17DRAFT_1136185 [Mycena rosella]